MFSKTIGPVTISQSAGQLSITDASLPGSPSLSIGDAVLVDLVLALVSEKVPALAGVIALAKPEIDAALAKV